MKRSRLHEVEDWPLEAKMGHYHVETVAQQLNVSTRRLEQFFKAEFGESPHTLFARWRSGVIRGLARQGGTGDTIAMKVGFAGRANLSRSIRHESGCTLEELRKKRFNQGFGK